MNTSGPTGTRGMLSQMLYASGNMGKSSLWSFVELFALFYFTDVLGIPASVAGTVILLSLIWDALTDPVMGLVADKLRRRFPTVRIYFFLGAPVAAAAFVALFLASAIPVAWRAGYILLVLVVFRTAYTIVDVPHNSMLSFLSRDSRDRTNIASMRIFFSAAGKLLVTLTSMIMLEGEAIEVLETHFTLTAAGLAGIYLLVLGVCLAAIWNIGVDQGSGARQSIRFYALFRNMTANSQLMIVFALTAITSLTTPVIGSALIYFGKYALGDERLGANALVIMSAAQALSLLFWSKLSNRLTYKKHAAQLANLTLATGMAIAVSVMASAPLLYVVAGLAGFAIGGIYMLNWSMLPDALEYGVPPASAHQYDFSVFGLFTLTNKAFIGLSQAMFGWTLAFYGYQPDSAAAEESIGLIISTLLAFPLVGALACTGLLRNHVQPQTARDPG